jgi:hypothetical protein
MGDFPDYSIYPAHRGAPEYVPAERVHRGYGNSMQSDLSQQETEFSFSPGSRDEYMSSSENLKLSQFPAYAPDAQQCWDPRNFKPFGSNMCSSASAVVNTSQFQNPAFSQSFGGQTNNFQHIFPTPVRQMDTHNGSSAHAYNQGLHPSQNAWFQPRAPSVMGHFGSGFDCGDPALRGGVDAYRFAQEDRARLHAQEHGIEEFSLGPGCPSSQK